MHELAKRYKLEVSWSQVAAQWLALVCATTILGGIAWSYGVCPSSACAQAWVNLTPWKTLHGWKLEGE